MREAELPPLEENKGSMAWLASLTPPSPEWHPLAPWGTLSEKALLNRPPEALKQPAAAWLSGLASPAIAHLELPLRLFKLFCDLNLENAQTSNPSRLANPSTEHQTASENSLGLWIDLFRHSPETFLPELTGFTLSHLQGPWRDVFCFESEIEAKSLWALCAYDSKRVIQGALLYQYAFDAILVERTALLEQAPPRLEETIIEILSAKISGAIGHHGHIRIGNKTLDAWLKEAQNKPELLLTALRGSPWLNASEPKQSRLLQATGFGGPMFGVFSTEEIALLEHWIRDPNEPSHTTSDKNHAQKTMAPLVPPPVWETEPPPAPTEAGFRCLYTHFLNLRSTEGAPAAARTLIEKTLVKARLMRWLGFGPAKDSDMRIALEYLVNRAHAKAEGEKHQPPKVDGAFCRWVIQQLAPSILVDGAWLSGIPRQVGAVDAWDLELLHILADEIGMGRTDWNHGNVYRSLLNQQAIALPDFRDKQFSQNPKILTAAFELPALLMAFGLEVRDYRPEILGLNLAIELSGLGSSYQKAIGILERNQIDPTIIRLHLSIDNLASGHAGRAQRAIVLFLDEITRLEGEDGRKRSWKRILEGYQCLQVATLQLSIQIVVRFLAHRLGFRMSSPPQNPSPIAHDPAKRA